MSSTREAANRAEMMMHVSGSTAALAGSVSHPFRTDHASTELCVAGNRDFHGRSMLRSHTSTRNALRVRLSGRYPSNGTADQPIVRVLAAIIPMINEAPRCNMKMAYMTGSRKDGNDLGGGIIVVLFRNEDIGIMPCAFIGRVHRTAQAGYGLPGVERKRARKPFPESYLFMKGYGSLSSGSRKTRRNRLFSLPANVWESRIRERRCVGPSVQPSWTTGRAWNAEETR